MEEKKKLHDAAAANDTKPAPRERYIPETIGIGAAIGNLGWSTATVLAKMPELAVLGGGATLGALGVWQSVHAFITKMKKNKGDTKNG
jgi:hypothetical protein